MTDGLRQPTGGVAPEGATPDHEREEMAATRASEATDAMKLDEQALVLRSQSKGFGKIAEALGLSRANDANEAFNRALRRRPAEEQASIRSDENHRLDRLRDAVNADTSRTKEQIAKRLRAIDRLRARLMTD